MTLFPYTTLFRSAVLLPLSGRPPLAARSKGGAAVRAALGPAASSGQMDLGVGPQQWARWCLLRLGELGARMPGRRPRTSSDVGDSGSDASVAVGGVAARRVLRGRRPDQNPIGLPRCVGMPGRRPRIGGGFGLPRCVVPRPMWAWPELVVAGDVYVPALVAWARCSG